MADETTPEATEAAVAHAEATGVDLSTVEGTGAGGKITKADVAAAAADAPAEAAASDAAPDPAPPDIHFAAAERATLQRNRDALAATIEAATAELAEIDAKLKA